MEKAAVSSETAASFWLISTQWLRRSPFLHLES